MVLQTAAIAVEAFILIAEGVVTKLIIISIIIHSITAIREYMMIVEENFGLPPNK